MLGGSSSATTRLYQCLPTKWYHDVSCNNVDINTKGHTKNGCIVHYLFEDGCHLYNGQTTFARPHVCAPWNPNSHAPYQELCILICCDPWPPFEHVDYDLANGGEDLKYFSK